MRFAGEEFRRRGRHRGALAVGACLVAALIVPAVAFADKGGAVCYVSGTPGFVDCVSWGNFSGSLPSPTGGNVDPAGIPDTKAIRRSIARGCPTLLEGPDDTNSPSNWGNVTPAPLNN